MIRFTTAHPAVITPAERTTSALANSPMSLIPPKTLIPDQIASRLR
jgi:hypothetical protein